MEQAYRPTTSAQSAKRLLDNLARSLDDNHPGAATSLRKGLDETLTIKTMDLPDRIARSLATTNAIENLNGTVRTVSRWVKTWRSGTMILRWVATGVFEASKGFRRLNGHTGMPRLIDALKRRDVAISSDNIKQVG